MSKSVHGKSREVWATSGRHFPDVSNFLNHFGNVLADFPRVNLTQRKANLAQLTMTALFYRQDALTGPNLTQRGPNLAQIYVTLQ